MAVPIHIRPLTYTDDLAAFGQMLLAAYVALPGYPPDESYDTELIDVAHRLETDIVLGAFDGDVPLGCVTYVNDPSSPHAELLGDDEASFRMLAVDLAAQGRGVGDALSNACIQRARVAGRAAVFIYSGAWMAAAHRLYGRLGFERVPDRDRVVHVAPAVDVELLAFRLALD